LYAVLSDAGKIDEVTRSIVWPKSWNGKKVLSKNKKVIHNVQDGEGGAV
jgi:hypothetical protein